jgi:hypothetical protein
MGDAAETLGDVFSSLFKPKTPKLPKENILLEADEAGVDAAEAERRRRNQTDTKRSGSASSALSAAIGKTTLGGA